MSFRHALVAALGALVLSGCAIPAIDPYQPTIANAQAVRAVPLTSARVGSFALAPGLPPGMDRSIGIRASTLKPPNGGSFSAYLAECLAAELRAAGKYDVASDIEIRGLLTESRVSSGVGVGEASLGATFTVSRRGLVLYEKALRVDSVWQSNFIGAIAIPEAMNQYTALYAKLIGALMADEAFRTAVRTA